jgi:hypothetical protein
MLPLVEALIEKTYWHRQRLARKFSKTISRLGKGEFRLNVLDPDAGLSSRKPNYWNLSMKNSSADPPGIPRFGKDLSPN